MDLPSFRRLLTPEGQLALEAATDLGSTDDTLLASLTRLRKQFPEVLATAALETVMLRRKAAAKFSHAEQMYFTREALEQASGEVISAYRSRRFAGFVRVADLCCGIGGDAIGLSSVANVLAVDADPLRAAMAEENLRAYGRDRATVVCADVVSVPLPFVTASFLDPDRRAGGRRHLRLRDYAPPPELVRGRFPSHFPLGVKVAPAVPRDDLRNLDAETEFISVDGELKECVLWFGPLKTSGRRATVLPTGESLAADRPSDPEAPGAVLAYLYDPDAAVVRSSLVSDLGRVIGARPIDPDIAYLTSDRYVATAFARAYRVDAVLPFHARQLGDRLRSMNVGPVTLTKRGSAVDVDELRRKWRLSGTEARTVVLTRALGKPTAVIARPAGNGPAGGG